MIKRRRRRFMARVTTFVTMLVLRVLFAIVWFGRRTRKKRQKSS